MKVSVTIPCYNEKATVRTLLRQVTSATYPKGIDRVEILVVDDCSKDGSRDILTAIKNNPAEEIGLLPNQEFRLHFQEQNGGKGKAMRTAFSLASGDIILVQDADLEYDPEDYPALLRPIVNGYADVVFGSRFIGQERRVLYYYHYLVNLFLTFLSNLLTNLNITDMETCYKVFRREVIQSIPIEENRFGFEPEITVKVARRHLRIYEVGISYWGRTYEEGKKIGWKDGVRALYCLLKYSLKERKTKEPQIEPGNKGPAIKTNPVAPAVPASEQDRSTVEH